MAITGFWPIGDSISRIISYVVNPEKTIAPEDMSDDLKKVIRYTSDPGKTDKLMYVSALNCPWQQAYEWMTATKKRYGKLGGNTCYHGFQSFYGKEVSPEEAHALGMETARRMWGDEYEVLVTTHLNTKNIHNHFVVNSVSFRTGRKYENHKKDHQRLREVSDELCREHGLYVIEKPRSHGLSFAEWRAHKDGQLTMKDMLELDMRECIDRAIDVQHFYRLMQEIGYTVDHRCKYPSFLPPGGKRPLRLKKGGKSMTEDDIEEMLWDSFERQTEVLVIPRAEKPPVPYYKGIGLSALVLSWMYVLGIIGKGKKVVYRVNREEVRKLKRYIRQHDLLDKYSIDNEDQLDAHAAIRAAEYAELEERRAELRKEQRRTKEPIPEIAELTKQMRFVRRELRICEDIKADIPKMQKAFEDVPEIDGKPMYYEEER
ncbi:MAG: relaxase/mobilization nuclease domain-containing protein [Clostridiales bacterium]|nr:relaxase/mobilization nuclease domain-containing protein [Clostridiales bacterium]